MAEELMNALFWNGPSQIEVGQAKIPPLKDEDSLLVAVKACAICGSDLRTYHHGNPRISAPKIIGHEISGVVEKVGKKITRFKVGDRVSVGADIPCGQCHYCEKGHPNNCLTNMAIGYQYDGGFADYIALDTHVVNGGPIQTFSPTLSFNEAALAEPLACCINGYEVGLAKENQSIAIFGAGPIGIMLAMLANTYKADQVFIIDPSIERLQKACALDSRFVTLDPNATDIVETILDKTHQRGVDLVFTACPVVETHRLALKIVAKRGVVNFFGGLPKGAPNVEVSTNHLHYNEIYLTGSHGSTPAQHKKALSLLESKQIDGNFLVTNTYPLKEADVAFKMALGQNGLKVVICP